MQLEQIDIDTEVIHDAGTSAPIEKSARRMPASLDWKKQAQRIPMSDWLIFGGAAACLLTLAISAGKPAPQIAKKVEPQFNPALLEEYAQADIQEFMGNFDAFLADQERVLLAQRAIEYRDSAKDFKNTKANDGCFGAKNRNECLSTFLPNRIGELDQVLESGGNRITATLTKTEARALVNFRTQAILGAVFSSDLPDIPPSDNAMRLQMQMAAKAVQAREGASAEGVARQQLNQIEEDTF